MFLMALVLFTSKNNDGQIISILSDEVFVDTLQFTFI